MKKLSALLMVFLVLISMVSVTANAENDPVNYAQKGVYEIIPGNSVSGYLENADATVRYGDDDFTLLTDGVSPYYTTTTEEGKVIAGSEKAGESIVLVGTSAVHEFKFYFDATYGDIYEIKFSNVWDSHNFGWENGQDGKGNRGFDYKKAIINLSTDGLEYKRTKDYEIIVTNHTEDGSENGYYDYTFKFNEPVSAYSIQIMAWSPNYCFSISEIEIWGRGNAIGPVPEITEESSEDTIEESSEEAEPEASEEASVEEASVEESKAEESKAEESKAEESKAEASSEAPAEESGSPVLVIVIVVVAVVVIAAVVIVILKKRS